MHGNGNAQTPAAGPPDPPPPDARGWFRKRREQVEHKFVELRDTVEAKRETSTPIAVAYDTFGRDTSTGGSVLAAALGFRIFLFYVPYIFFFTFAFGLGADAADESASDWRGAAAWAPSLPKRSGARQTSRSGPASSPSS